MWKERKKKNIIKRVDKRLINLQNKVIINSNKICDFNDKIILNNVPTNSCFNLHKFKLSETFDFVPNININNNNKEIPTHKSIIVDMFVNNKQEKLLGLWFSAFISMYNITINHFKNLDFMDDIKNLKIIYDKFYACYKLFKIVKDNRDVLLKEKKKLITLYNKLLKVKNNKNKLNIFIQQIFSIKNKIKDANIKFNNINKDYVKINKIKNVETYKVMKKFNWQILRTNSLKGIKNHIQIKSGTNYNDKIRIHILDCAIKMACASFKSCITNFVNGHIKRFRVKYWNENKNTKIIELEKEFIKKGKLLPNVFGDLKLLYDKKDYILENDTVKIMYMKDINKYYLLVSKKLEVENHS